MVGVLQGFITETFTLFTFTLSSAKYYILLYFLCQIILPIKGNPNGNLLRWVVPEKFSFSCKEKISAIQGGVRRNAF